MLSAAAFFSQGSASSRWPQSPGPLPVSPGPRNFVEATRQALDLVIPSPDHPTYPFLRCQWGSGDGSFPESHNMWP